MIKIDKQTVLKQSKGRSLVYCTGVCPHCKKEFTRLRENFKRAKSCGCKPRRFVHGMTRTRPYITWRNMVRRCENPADKCYEIYGGRGIKVCDGWKNFNTFWMEMKEGYSDELTIDRIDSNGNYCKENCKWSTIREQSINKRNSIVFKGECAREAGIRINGNPSLVYQRLNAGWSKEKAFTKLSLRQK